MKLRWIPFFWLVLLGAAPPLEEKLGVLLTAIHQLPPKESFVAVGSPEEVQAALVRIAADERIFLLHRSRAVEALAYFPGPRVAELYAALLGAPRTPPGMRLRLIALYGRDYPKDAPRVLAPFLLSADPTIRAVTQRALDRP